MILVVGNSYLAIQEAGEIVVSDTEKHEFTEKRFEFEVLSKPETVTVEDGDKSAEIPLPTHLRQGDWYFVRNLTTDKRHWLNPTHYEVSELQEA